MKRLFASIAAGFSFFFAATAAFALCAPVAEGPGARVWPAAVLPEGLPPKGSVEVTYIGHSTFLIRTPGGISVATDYNDHVRPPIVPTVATMNRAHTTHFSYAPDPGIKHVLRGWKEGGVAEHDVTAGDMHIFNVPTNIRNWGNHTTDYAGNSIFVFEVSGICIAHLGHLHHTLTPEHLKRLGPIDIVMIAVDGSVTLTQEDAFKVVEEINPKVVIPMHFFGEETLERFAALFAKRYPVKRSESPTVLFSRPTLPDKQLLILPGH
ncbi:MAG: MBL fold metallo-hydrolase [Rhodospirillaceae bacterium]|nr:MBL fold metallo-hydrolase [Rhodospirillaceae bacterium]